MLTKTEAIVLRAFKYGDHKMIIDMFTKEHGRLSFAVKLSNSSKGKMKKQLFQPLTLLTIECDVRPRLQLQKLTGATIHPPLPSLQTDPAKLSITLFLSEFLYHALKGEQQNILLFDYIANSLLWLESSTEHIANFHLVFVMRMSRFLGFYPNLEGYSTGDYFDLRASTFSAFAPTHRDSLGPEEARKVQLMMRMDYATMHVFKLSRNDRQRLLRIALTYYRLHLPSFPELHSLQIFQELFED